MKQGNAIDLLGQDDPRATTIGIIYVSPTDDRRSVLTAIFTQEKLERKQIAIVLPTQNKAFHRPADFDDLKNVRRKLQAELVFIAPGGLGSPAEFARQRRFPVYSSLEYYARALREQPASAAAPARKRGWLPGRSGPADPAAAPADKQMPPVEPPLVVPLPPVAASDPDADRMNPIPLRRGRTPSGVAPAGDIQNMPTTPINTAAPALPPADPRDDEDEWALSPDPVAPGPVINSGTIGTAGSAAAAVPPSSPPPATPAGAEPGIIMLGGGTKTRRKTVELPRNNPPASPAPPAIEDIPTQTIPPAQKPKRAQSGKIAAIGAATVIGAGLAAEEIASHAPGTAPTGGATGTAGTAGTSAGAGSPPAPPAAEPPVPVVVPMVRPGQPGGPGNVPPNTGGRGGRGGQGRGRRKLGWGLIAVILVVCTLLLFGAIALAAPGLIPSVLKSGPAYSVSITPDTKPINNTYVVTAVTGTPDTTNGLQVQAVVLTGQAQSTPKTVNATGQGTDPATSAKGLLTFYNSNRASITIARVPLTGSDGVKVEIDAATITIPAGSPASPHAMTVNATAVRSGASGNIPAEDLSAIPCCASGIIVENLTAFSGGKDAQPYTAVKQSDISNVSDPIIPGLTTQAQQTMNVKLTKNLRYAEQGSCTPTVDSDHTAGTRATTVTVTVAVDCQREAYDVSQIPSVVTTQMQQTVSNQLGADASFYKMIDAQSNLTSLAAVTEITLARVDAATQIVTLDVKASAFWVYQIPDTQLQAMKAHIAGKTAAQALTYLKSQPGVFDASIQPSSGTLPTDVGQIGLSLVKQTGPAGSGGGTPGGGGAGGTPVITSPTAGPIPTQSGIGKG